MPQVGTAATQVEWGEHRVRLHLHFTAKAAAEAQKPEAEEAGSVG